MSDVLYNEIPSLDLSDFTKGNDELRSKFVADLGAAYNNIGFVAIKNHGLSDKLVEKLYETVQKFFALPDEIKTKYQ